ncbi:NAD(P)-binding protein [Mycena rebaudengoi]|nr:NAD(P)-binding protein [Mycena rebaudengoi]
MADTQKKLILVIGATGAQGMAVIDGLLADMEDGQPSPYRVRALTRDLTDTFTVGEMREILPYIPKTRAGYDPAYQVEHLNVKGRVGEFIQNQPSVVSDTELSWTSVNTGVYMEMLEAPFLGPWNVREDGTRVFASILGDGHVSMMTLKDIGFWGRWIFDHRLATSGQDLKVASDMINWDNLVSTFTRVTGKPAVHLRLTEDEFWGYFINAESTPMAYDAKIGDGTPTVKENYTMWYKVYRDDIIERDMEWVREIHPGTQDTEAWIRETGWMGIPDNGPLKGQSGIVPNLEKMKLI